MNEAKPITIGLSQEMLDVNFGMQLVKIARITGGALDARETEPGPIMIQGDHEKVWYRKVVVTPITSGGGGTKTQ